MDLGLKGKKVIVTGGSRGLGREALEHFAAEGADIAFFSRNAEQVKAAAIELESHGGKVFAESFEVSDMPLYSAWLEKAVDALGGCDIFVHNISSAGLGGWDGSFNLDIKTAVTSIKTLEPYLEQSEDGSVIFMCSTAAVETFIRPQAYNAMKAALITYGSQLSQSLGPKGIRVNMISPGPTSFPGGDWAKIKDGKPDFYASHEALVSLGRLGQPDDIAKTVVFISSPASSYTTGTNVIIDGGYTKRVQF